VIREIRDINGLPKLFCSPGTCIPKTSNKQLKTKFADVRGQNWQRVRPHHFLYFTGPLQETTNQKTKNSKNKLNHFLSGHVGSVPAVRFGSRRHCKKQ
jgi:hypothetical protein